MQGGDQEGELELYVRHLQGESQDAVNSDGSATGLGVLVQAAVEDVLEASSAATKQPQMESKPHLDDNVASALAQACMEVLPDRPLDAPVLVLLHPNPHLPCHT